MSSVPPTPSNTPKDGEIVSNDASHLMFQKALTPALPIKKPSPGHYEAIIWDLQATNGQLEGVPKLAKHQGVIARSREMVAETQRSLEEKERALVIYWECLGSSNSACRILQH
ncbi:hypothetical protein V5O48_017173 [Marasmius crinis-equi]|uniref:Uncharacterized protein n=1 Tax=Marasmius crinis-equi TaxID=585013 RepID=A0ABR3EPQ4_9AGAR